MKLILVRHGHTNDLKHDIVQGHRQVPLNRLGLRQAERVARRLKTVAVSAIISSDSRRTVQTAIVIQRYHPRVPLELSSLLREKGSGIYEGRLRSELSAHIRRQGNTAHWRPRRGESHVDLFKRARVWYRAFRRQPYRGTIVLVSHGGFIRSLLTIMFHGGRFQFRREYHHDNTGVTVVNITRTGRATLASLNDVSHLRGLRQASNPNEHKRY